MQELTSKIKWHLISGHGVHTGSLSGLLNCFISILKLELQSIQTLETTRYLRDLCWGNDISAVRKEWEKSEAV